MAYLVQLFNFPTLYVNEESEGTKEANKRPYIKEQTIQKKLFKNTNNGSLWLTEN